MKVLLINGSPHAEGHCASALSIISGELLGAGIDTVCFRADDFSPRGCNACGGCRDTGRCVFSDLSELSESFRESAGLVVAAPVYYGSPRGSVISLLDRLFQSSKFEKRGKVGAAFVTARRGGCTASFDVINKYFAISQMPIATSNYWNLIHTGTDAEGERTARILGQNMAFLIKAIASQ